MQHPLKKAPSKAASDPVGVPEDTLPSKELMKLALHGLILRQRGPIRLRAPQIAPAPMLNRKIKPINRPDRVLLLQPWSTAMSQTRNKTIAPEARTLVHILHTPALELSFPSITAGMKGLQSRASVTEPAGPRRLPIRACLLSKHDRRHRDPLRVECRKPPFAQA